MMQRTFWAVGTAAAGAYLLSKVPPLGWFLLFLALVFLISLWPVLVGGAILYGVVKGYLFISKRTRWWNA